MSRLIDFAQVPSRSKIFQMYPREYMPAPEILLMISFDAMLLLLQLMRHKRLDGSIFVFWAFHHWLTLFLYRD